MADSADDAGNASSRMHFAAVDVDHPAADLLMSSCDLWGVDPEDQVSADGDLANWHTGHADDIPAVGGAMDLAIGAKQTFVMMNLLRADATAKLLRECTYPITGLACVTRVYTDLAVFLIEPGPVVVRDLFGIYFDRLTGLLDIPLHDGSNHQAGVPLPVRPDGRIDDSRR